MRVTLTVIVIAASIACASPVFAQLAYCPAQGDAHQALARELNVYKNREDPPPATRIDRNATLAAVLAPGQDLERWSRRNGAVFEGVVVGVKPGSVETVNCHAKDLLDRDTHIELALNPDAEPRARVIVEVTPRWRRKMSSIADWSTAALNSQLLGHRVRITGWLFDDLEHKRQAENTNPGGATNWRATIWEIHPVTAIVVLPIVAAAPITPSIPSAVHHRAHHHPTKVSRRCRIRGRLCRRQRRHLR